MLWLVATAAFMQMLDTTIVNTALPSMATGLGESPLRMQAVVAVVRARGRDGDSGVGLAGG